MIIWSGAGFVSAIIFMIGAGGGSALFGPQLGVGIGALVAAVANFFLGRFLNDANKDRIVVDAKTGQRLRLRTRSTLFWLPMEWWSVVMVLVAVVNIYQYFVG